MEITTNIGCKVHCAYCPQDKLIRAYNNIGEVSKRMTFETYKTILHKVSLNEIIQFSGFSEPWLNSECTEMVFYAHSLGYKIAVFTTAVGMTISDVEKIKTIPFKFFRLHLPDMEGHAKIKLEKDYLKTIDAIINGNIQNCDFMTMGTLPIQIRKMIGKRLIARTEMYPRAGNLMSRNDVIIPPRRKGPIRCSRSRRGFSDHNIVLPNGDVVLCCNDFGLQHILGNLIVSDYNSLFANESFKRLRSGLDDDSIDILCRYCEYAFSPIRSKILYLKHFLYNKSVYVRKYL